MKGLQGCVGVAALFFLQGVLAQDTIREIKWSPGQPAADPAHPTLIEVQASKSSKFFFPYYLYVPADLPKERTIRLLVEPNKDTDKIRVEMCVQRRLACSVGDRPTGVRVRAP